MKLLVLSVCVLVLVALSNAKPCSGPRCKRTIRGQYSDYGDYGMTMDNGGYNNGNQNGGYAGPTDGRQNGNKQNRYSDCPNCYAYDFGNGDYNHNTVNVEKK